MLTNKINKIKLKEVVGKGYGTYWNFKGRYRVVKGSRASKKSKTTALWYIVNIIKHPKSNLLVIRKTYRTLKDSCFAELRWAINRLRVQDYFDIKLSPLEITYKPTGQKIYFRGLDDPLKITSITVDVGYLCWCWIEEAYEISKESDFDIIDESIRGSLSEAPSLFKQITLTFNPWNDKHWLKKRFFDVDNDSDILSITTNYLINEWLDKSDLKVFEQMKQNNFKRYKVAGLGDWGIVDGLVYENWVEEEFNIKDIVTNKNVKSAFGLDYGYTNDPTALFCGLVDMDKEIIYVFDELYEKGMQNEEIHKRICNMGYSKEVIYADSAEPKSNDRLRDLGLRVERARKGKDSVNNGIDFIKGFKIKIHPRCVNFITEISNYTWDTDRRNGFRINKPIDDFNHLMDAMRYAMEHLSRGSIFSFN